MANEIRRRVDFAAGGLSVGLSTVDTTMQSNGLQDLPALAADEYFPLSLFRLDALGRITQKEVVYMTAHSAAAGSGTILRAQEGTTAQLWNAGDRWSLAHLARDPLVVCKSSTQPATPYDGMMIKELDTDYVRFWSGVTWRHVANMKMFGAGSAMKNGPPPTPDGASNTPPFLVQAGTNVVTADGGGGAGVTYPVAFPNGVLSVVLCNGDPGVHDDIVLAVEIGSGATNLSGVWFTATNNAGARYGGLTYRLNWIAIGW